MVFFIDLGDPALLTLHLQQHIPEVSLDSLYCNVAFGHHSSSQNCSRLLHLIFFFIWSNIQTDFHLIDNFLRHPALSRSKAYFHFSLHYEPLSIFISTVIVFLFVISLEKFSSLFTTVPRTNMRKTWLLFSLLNHLLLSYYLIFIRCLITGC